MDSTPECVSEFQPFINALLTETPVIVHVGSMFPDTYNEGTNFGKSMKELDEIEAQYEKKLDDLFTCERSLDEIEHEVGAIKEQEARDEKKKMECEQSLVYMLKERELALRDQFLLMEKVDELEANPIKHQDTQEEIDHVNTQLAHMEQELVASKLELADVKGVLEERQKLYRVLEKQFVHVKLDVATSQASCDDFRVSLEHVLREKSSLQEQMDRLSMQLMQVHGMDRV